MRRSVQLTTRSGSTDKSSIDGWQGVRSSLRSQYCAENSLMAFYDSINRTNLIDHLAKQIEKQRLWPIAKRTFRVGMYIYQPPVRACRDARASHRDNYLPSTCAVTR